MKKIFTLVLSTMAFSVNSALAHDFIVLSTPEEIIAHSTEIESGAKAEFQAIIDTPDATETQITSAIQEYLQKANPNAGYGFDMTFLFRYNAVTDENKGKYTQANLAEYWKTDIEGITFGSNNVFMVNSTDAAGIFMRLYNNTDPFPLRTEGSYNKFAIYQTIQLTGGSYQLETSGFVAGAAGTATLSAGELANSAAFQGGGVLKSYKIDFKLGSSDNIKLGIKRNSTPGNLTTIAFNNMYLYKVSDVIEITDNATGPLAAATEANVQLSRDFNTNGYVPICLPFIVENWRDIFDDLLLWNDYTDEGLSFKTVSGANTQARKPYLAKAKESINANNYLIFNDVNIENGNAGSWVKNTDFPVKMVGNWATGTVPANCYYLDGNIWKLSDGTVTQPAFSAYIDATTLENHPNTLDFIVNNVNTGVTDVVVAEETIVTVYNIQGIVVRRNVEKKNALDGLPTGIYVMNGKKIVKR